MQAMYSAAIFWRPGFTLDPTNCPYLFLAEHVFPGPTGVQIVDEGYLRYDPFTGTCAVNVFRQKVGFYAFGSLQVGEYYGKRGSSGPNTADTPWTVNPDNPAFVINEGGFDVVNFSRAYVGNSSDWIFDSPSTLTVESGVTHQQNALLQYGAFAAGQSINAGSFTSTSTGYTATGGTSVGRAFTVPPSGDVLINYAGRMSNSGSTASTYITIQIRTGSTIGSGTVVLAASDTQAIDHAGSISDRNGAAYLFSGTVGSAYNVQLLHKVEAGTGTFSQRQCCVTASLC